MSKYLKMMLTQRGYMDEADDGTNKGGGGGGGSVEETAEQKAAREAKEADEAAKKAKPTDKEAALLKEVMDKKAALKKADEAVAQAKEQLKAFEGIDPVKVRELLKQQQDAETAALEAKGQFEQVKKQMVEAHNAEVKKKDETIQTLSAGNESLQKTIAELTVGNSFGQSKFILEELALTPSKARVVYGSHFEFKDGKVVGYDKPAGETNRTILVGASGDPLSFEDAIKKIVETDPDRDTVLKAKQKPGAGSGTKPENKGAPRQDRELSPREKIAQGLAKMSAAK